MKVLIFILFCLVLATHGAPIIEDSVNPTQESQVDLHRRRTKNPPVFSPLERGNKTVEIEKNVNIHHPITTTTNLPEDNPFARLDPIELSFWKKIKHEVDKALKKLEDKLLDGLAGAIGAGIVG